MLRYAILVAGAYLVLVGVSELAWVSTGSTTLAGIAAWPSLASAIDPLINSSDSANYVEGAIDGVMGAGLLWWAW